METGISFKEVAKQAKKRLMTGYWESVRKDRDRFMETHFHKGDNISQLKTMFNRKIQRDLFGKSSQNDADEKLYRKVVKMLSENDYVLNPIRQLIDHDVYDKLDEHAKQNYIFELSDKYNQLKERYEHEKMSGFAVNS